ncbi:unnamed protein product, partial [marine sediment metagenome]
MVSKPSALAKAYQPLTIIGEYAYLPAYLSDIHSFLIVDEYATRVTEAPLAEEFTLRIKDLDSIIHPINNPNPFPLIQQ